jgi:hypothetical protein
MLIHLRPLGCGVRAGKVRKLAAQGFLGLVAKVAA